MDSASKFSRPRIFVTHSVNEMDICSIKCQHLELFPATRNGVIEAQSQSVRFDFLFFLFLFYKEKEKRSGKNEYLN
jgi:hypothetical protein